MRGGCLAALLGVAGGPLGSARAVVPPPLTQETRPTGLGAGAVAPAAAPAAGTAPADAAPAEAPPERPALAGLRPLTGSVGLIGRGTQTMPVYTERLAAALFTERAHDTVSPYVVSIANSLEALDPRERAPGTRAERLLLQAYVMLAALDGPQVGRLGELYAAGLSQALGVKPEDVAVTEELHRQLRQIGAYAGTAAAAALGRAGGDAGRLALRTELLLNQGRYAEAARAAAEWEGAKDGRGGLSRTYRLGAQLLSGQAAARKDLQALSVQPGPVGLLATNLLRRAAREALVVRLWPVLSGAGAAPAVQQAATAWRKPGDKGSPAEHPLHEACVLLAKAGQPEAARADCSLLLLDGGGLLGAAEIPWPQRDGGRRVVLLQIARGLGQLVGLLGKRRSDDPKVRAAALAEVQRLLPQADLPAEDAGAVDLLARIGAAARPGLPADLQGPVDQYLQGHPCTPLMVPLLVGRHTEPAARVAALDQALSACQAATPGAAPRRDEATRMLGLLLLAADTGSERAYQALTQLAARRGAAPGEGRFLLAAADAELVRAVHAQAPETEEWLVAQQRRYEEASAGLVPWDGTELKGHAEAQVAALLLRRHQLTRRAERLHEADQHLRWAQLVASPEDAALVEALEVYTGRELRLLQGKAPAAPKVDLSRMPDGLGRRVLACELSRAAAAAKDGAAAARYRAVFGSEPVPRLTQLGAPRLQAALGADEVLRVQARGEVRLISVPPCK